nr:DUF6286 domain-containing protein [Kineococcus aurantiacus]
MWLVATGFSRRSRRTVRLQGSASATTTTRDVARLATGAARQQDGVLHASSRAGRRRVDVTVSATTPLVRATVETAVRTALDRLDPAPRVRVRLEAPAAVAAAPGARPTSAVGGTS